MNPWDLPETVVIGGREYEIHTDFRNILNIMRQLDDPNEDEYVKWYVAMSLFYVGEIPEENELEAMEYMAAFISYGEKDSAKPGARLMDWEQDAQAIIADVNKVAGKEIRVIPYMHWWTFLSYFQAIGEGQLSTIVSIRDKIRRGKSLEKWEKDYYQENKNRVDLKKKYSAEDIAEQDRLRKLLGG